MLNLTGKKTTQKLIKSGVVDPSESTRKRIIEMMQFTTTPMDSECDARAKGLLVVVNREQQIITTTDEILIGSNCFPALAIAIYKEFTNAGYDVYFEFNGTDIVSL